MDAERIQVYIIFYCFLTVFVQKNQARTLARLRLKTGFFISTLRLSWKKSVLIKKKSVPDPFVKEVAEVDGEAKKSQTKDPYQN